MDDDGDTLLIRDKFVEFISRSSFHKSPLSGDSTRDNVSIFLSPDRQAAIETTVLHRQAAIETTAIDSSTLIEWSRLWGAR